VEEEEFLVLLIEEVVSEIVVFEGEEKLGANLSDSAMISLSSFLEELLVLLHLIVVREGDTVDTLQRFVRSVTEEVRRGVL